MATVLNRNTLQVLYSVNTPDYPSPEWLVHPDLTPVQGYPNRYWVINGNTLSVMSQEERDAVDLAIANAEKDAIAEQLNVSGFDKAFAQVMLDQLNVLREAAGMQTATLTQLKNAVRSKL